MHTISVSENSLSPSAPTHDAADKKKVDLADAATILPGLQQSRLLLDTAIRVLSYFVPPPPEGVVSNAEAAARIRRAFAELGHPSVRR
ncbi:MAG: hypothetical protein WDO56_08405 [Gammaproteobacteria bacterium]